MAGLRFAILGSGSRGNATLIDDGRTRILIDCGFNLGETERRLERLGVAPGSVSAIVVTHEHGDHVRGAGMLARRHGIPVWMTPGTLAALPTRIAATMPEPERYDPHTPFAIDGLSLHPLPVPHDAREPSQFVVTDGARRLGVLSDAGHITQHMITCLSGLDALLLEANHDPDMLAEGPYPPALKLRVGGSLGHLSNHQSAQLLGAVDTSRLQHVVLTHLSEQNNTPERARGVAAGALGCTPDWLGVAHQDDGLAWRAV